MVLPDSCVPQTQLTREKMKSTQLMGETSPVLKPGKKFREIGVLRLSLHNAWDGLRSKWVLQKIYPATGTSEQMAKNGRNSLEC